MGLTQVSTDGVKNDAITKVKIPANQIEASELADNAVDTNAIANTAVTLAKLEHGTGSNDGKFLRANNGADPTFETVNTDLVSDTSPQLGGALASNGHNILIADNDIIKVGTNNDLLIYHVNNNSYIQDNGAGDLFLQSESNIKIKAGDEDSIICNDDGAVELYHDNTKTFNTDANGIRVLGPADGVAQVEIYSDRGDDDQDKWRIQASSSGQFLKIQTYGSGSWQDTISAQSQNQVRLFYNGSEKLNTSNNGVSITGKIYMNNGNLQFGASGAGVDFSSTSDASGMSNELLDDYEEGTWTPVFQAYNGSAWVDVTFDNALDNTQGKYTKIGNIVHFWYYTGSFSTDSGFNTLAARISGLPYVVHNTSPLYGHQFIFTHTTCFKDTSNNLTPIYTGYGGAGGSYFYPNLGNNTANARWGSEGTRYMMCAGTYQTG